MKKQIISLLLLFASICYAADPITIWISSYQDKKYYENLVQKYKQIDKDFDANVQAYGFMEMPDKLGAAMKTGKGGPDIVQLDEMTYSMFLRGPSPFVDLTERMKKAKLVDQFHKQRLSLFTNNKKIYGIPQSLSSFVLYYRKDLFAEWGFSVERGNFPFLLPYHPWCLSGVSSGYGRTLFRDSGGLLFR